MLVLRAFHNVFSHLGYIASSVFLAVAITVVTLLWPNQGLLFTVWGSELTTLSFKFSLTLHVVAGAWSSMGALTVVVIVLTASLIGLVASMAWYAWRAKQLSHEIGPSFTIATGTGIFAALLGIGCVACGPLLVTAILALVGGAGLLVILPLHGTEFGLLALGLLGYAVYVLAKVIAAPAVCVIWPDVIGDK